MSKWMYSKVFTFVSREEAKARLTLLVILKPLLPRPVEKILKSLASVVSWLRLGCRFNLHYAKNGMAVAKKKFATSILGTLSRSK